MKKLLPILLLSIASILACDKHDNYIVNDYIKDFIELKYKGARILYAEKDYNGEIDVEIIHDNTRKEVKFNRKNVWIETTWNIAISQLPNIVMKNILDRYPEYRIDDANYIEKKSGEYYKIEIEKGEWDKTIFMTPNGDFIN